MSRNKDFSTRPAQQVRTPEVQEASKRVVDKHRECPLCYTGAMGGVGQANGMYAKNQTISQRFYKCDMCGHTWSVLFEPEKIVKINNGLS